MLNPTTFVRCCPAVIFTNNATLRQVIPLIRLCKYISGQGPNVLSQCGIFTDGDSSRWHILLSGIETVVSVSTCYSRLATVMASLILMYRFKQVSWLASSWKFREVNARTDGVRCKGALPFFCIHLPDDIQALQVQVVNEQEPFGDWALMMELIFRGHPPAAFFIIL